MSGFQLVAETVVAQAVRFPGSRIALVGGNGLDLAKMAAEVVSAADRLYIDQSPKRKGPPSTAGTSHHSLVWPNGSVATCFREDRPDQLRGPQFHLAWAQGVKHTKTMDLLRLGLRLGDYPFLLEA